MKSIKFVFVFFSLLTTAGFSQSVLKPNPPTDSTSIQCPLKMAKVNSEIYKIDYSLINSPKRILATRDPWKVGWGNDPLPYYGGTSFRTSPIGVRQFKIPYYMWARQYDYTLMQY